MNAHLDETDLANLSGWMDGELTASTAADIERRVREDPAWGEAWEELKALETVLDAWTVPPAPATFPERLTRYVRGIAQPKPRVVRLLRWIAPAAAAAAIVLTVMLYTPHAKTPTRDREPFFAETATPDPVEQVLKDIPTGDRFIVEHLEFFRNYDLCSVMEETRMLDEATMDALDKLEAKGI